ncbi:hypothetical protein ACFL9T_17580 [Thermodesulfobacteriota bacterium]
MKQLNVKIEDIESILSEKLGCKVQAVESMGGGRNSKVYCVSCEDSVKYAVKYYFPTGLSDNRNRMNVEFNSLLFLWKNGERCIPRTVIADTISNCAVYEFIEGRKISSEDIDNPEIDSAVHFLARLNGIGKRNFNQPIPAASEACFSPQDIVKAIDSRLDRLSVHRENNSQYQSLHDFLTKDFRISFNEIKNWCRSELHESAMDFASSIDITQYTLSPSDFGFHNSLRRKDNNIIFLDFEYFGWDDPAKMIADFLLHPAVDLHERLRHQFFTHIIRKFKDDNGIKRRVKVIYPLLGLNWCLILLNEFVPGFLLRRNFAYKDNINRAKMQNEQLIKSRKMLTKIEKNYERFPYDE